MTIFIDMDGVMADSYKKHVELYNKEFNATFNHKLLIGEVWENVPEEHQSNVKGHCFREHYFSSLEPMKDSIWAIEKLTKKHDVYVASAAMEYPLSLKEKSEWLDIYFPFIPWKNRILCGNKSILKGDLLIDDRARNLENFEGDTILFTANHNLNEDRFTRMNNWKEIVDALLQ
ncbi:5'-3'-deoxyribonucleotidase [Urechidicola sp. KH5]